jgi:hypothetical protein
MDDEYYLYVNSVTHAKEPITLINTVISVRIFPELVVSCDVWK